MSPLRTLWFALSHPAGDAPGWSEAELANISAELGPLRKSLHRRRRKNRRMLGRQA